MAPFEKLNAHPNVRWGTTSLMMAYAGGITSGDTETWAMESYEIRIKGHISSKRHAAFAGLTVTLLPTGETVLAGPMDQAALHGILRRIGDMGLMLLLVQYKGTSDPGLPGATCPPRSPAPRLSPSSSDTVAAEGP